jgi:hypothetical protein
MIGEPMCFALEFINEIMLKEIGVSIFESYIVDQLP